MRGDVVRFDELMKDEHLLSQELEALDRRFESWSLPGAASDGLNQPVNGAHTQRTTVLPSSRDITANLPPDVAAFEVSVVHWWFQADLIIEQNRRSCMMKKCYDWNALQPK